MLVRLRVSLGILATGRFRSCVSGVGPEMLHFQPHTEKAAVLWTQGLRMLGSSAVKESTRNKRAFLELTGPKRRTT